MAKKDLPDIETLRQLVRYEPETGKLYWLHRPLRMFRSFRFFKMWNTKFAGKEAFTSDDGRGYRQGSLFNHSTRAHVVAYAIYYGEVPKNGIDHINGIKSDNRIINLRKATQSENMRNVELFSHNTSGHKGVSWDNQLDKWCAKIYHAKKNIHLGYFNNIQDAINAMKNAEEVYHGEYARK